jgi:hypothetical protein
MQYWKINCSDQWKNSQYALRPPLITEEDAFYEFHIISQR